MFRRVSGIITTWTVYFVLFRLYISFILWEKC